MSKDDELPLWKQKRLLELQRRLLTKEIEESQSKQQKPPSAEQRLSALFAGRAAEIYEAAKRQYPEATRKVTEALVGLVERGELAGPIDGEELYAFFRMIGMRVRLKTRISYVEDGKIKSIAERIRRA